MPYYHTRYRKSVMQKGDGVKAVKNSTTISGRLALRIMIRDTSIKPGASNLIVTHVSGSDP